MAQVIETSVQLALPLNAWLFVGSFIGTVMFYSYPYTRGTASSADPRVTWHRRHRGLVGRWQRWGLLALIALSVWMAIRHGAAIRTMTSLEWAVLLVVLAPFGLLVAGIVSLRRPRTIPYYLTVIDGLMLAKALLDSLAFRF